MEAVDESGKCICARCGVKITSKNKSKDHFIPQSFYVNPSGSSTLNCNNNIVICCRDCNNNIGNAPKSPTWYTFLSQEYKGILMQTTHLFVHNALKTPQGNSNIKFYSELLKEKIRPKIDIETSFKLSTLLLEYIDNGQSIIVEDKYKITKDSKDLRLVSI